MFQNEIYSLEILIDTYKNIMSEIDILRKYLNDYIKDSHDLNQLTCDEKIILSYNAKINNIIMTLKSIQENTTITNDYGQTNKPFNNINSANDYIKINYSQLSNINNLTSLKLLPICKLSSFYIDKINFNNKAYYLINVNKLDRIKSYEYYQAKIPIFTCEDLIINLISDSKDAILILQKINYLLELNIKRIELGIKQIFQISEIPI
jgi:hypothetical protein